MRPHVPNGERAALLPPVVTWIMFLCLAFGAGLLLRLSLHPPRLQVVNPVGQVGLDSFTAIQGCCIYFRIADIKRKVYIWARRQAALYGLGSLQLPWPPAWSRRLRRSQVMPRMQDSRPARWAWLHTPRSLLWGGPRVHPM